MRGLPAKNTTIAAEELRVPTEYRRIGRRDALLRGHPGGGQLRRAGPAEHRGDHHRPAHVPDGHAVLRRDRGVWHLAGRRDLGTASLPPRDNNWRDTVASN